MPIYVSTSCLINGSNIFDVLKTYAQAGLKYVELGSPHEYISSLSPASFKQYDFNLIAHHYFPPPRESFIVNLASQNPVILSQSQVHIERAIEFCHHVGIRLFTFHAGWRADPDVKFRFPQDSLVVPYDTAFSTFIESMDKINSYAQQRGVKIAIENNVLSEYNVVDGQNRFLLLCKADEFERLWERIPSANVGILLDLGHLKVTSHSLNFDRYQFIERVKDRVFALHVHENGDRLDEHRVLDETSWCLEVIGRSGFRKLPIILESTKLSVKQITQQVNLMKEVLGEEKD